MASSSSSSAAASTITRPRIAIAITSAIAAASLGYYYYQHHYLADELYLDPSNPGPPLHRRNAVRRPRRPNRRREESSGTDSQADDAAAFGPRSEEPDSEPSGPGILIPSPADVEGEQPEDWYNDSTQLNPRQRTGENIVTLLFRVSEDNARRNSYVHRGCLCNGCGMLPIRGIRYRCANCPDFDLCEMCESQGSHNKAHVFYKVKIPVPSSAARHVQPPWYPGDPSTATQTLPRELVARWASETGFERVELEALWEQWTFMANTEWRDDPNLLNLAMDRKTFERCLVPSAGYRHPAPNLIHDRMFAFYDTNNDGLIGFEEYLHGVSYKRRKDKLKRTFDGYDVDGDGYVNRRDFLRMFRAYYVSYRQMHRDTVEGLDDYLVTNGEVHSWVKGRQPLSGLFGREARIPDADSNRMMEGKIMRSSGEVDVPDGKGAVKEDKPDAASREDILRELFTRNSSQGVFTESFGSSSRRSQSLRDSQYWSGIIDPPRSTVDLTALLSGDQAQLDDIIHSIRRQPTQATTFAAEEDETSSSDDDGDDGTHDDHAYDDVDSTHDDADDDDGEMNQPFIDENADPLATQETIDAAQFMSTLPTEIRVQPPRETYPGSQQLYSEKRKRVMVRKQLYERWKRRQFYLDEEEGALPPQGWQDEQDILANINDDLEPPKSTAPLMSPRSRSSSKVRFAEDTDDFDTRSNHSASSRSVPERWGGMEIPDAERDAGKEILYQIAQQAFNELLDLLFKGKEQMAVHAAETKVEREKYRQFLNNVELQDEELPPKSSSPPLQQKSLQDLLSASGYTVADSHIAAGASNPDTQSRQRDSQDDHATTTTTRPSVAASSSNDSGLVTHEHRDPTLPQFMPNNAQNHPPQPVGGNKSDSNPASETTTQGPSMSTSEPNAGGPDIPSDIPRSKVVLYKIIDDAEQEARKRGGWGRLSYPEFEEIYRHFEFHDGSKNRLAYLGSWIDFCIPS